MPVIAASAGNHALAVARAGQECGVPTVLCLPTTAARAKRERLLGSSVTVIDYGETLDEATMYACHLAEREGWRFLSPFDDAEVIAGHATLARELLEEVPDIELILTPLGGGGLAAGCGLAQEDAGRKPNILGCQPIEFAPFASLMRTGELLHCPFRPSLADGLLVNPGEGAVTVVRSRDWLSGVITLDEEHLAAAVAALLLHESLLVEPSGAAGIAAVLQGALCGRSEAAVGIVLSGANLSSSTLLRCLVHPTVDPRMQGLLDLHGRSYKDQQIAHAEHRPAHRKGNIFADLRQETADRLHRGSKRIGELIIEARRDGLPTPHVMTETWQSFARAAEELASALCSSEVAAHQELLLRAGVRVTAVIDDLPAWRSPSYQESAVLTFARLGARRSGAVNYGRYGSPQVGELEEAWRGMLGFSWGKSQLLATSSGMAAYTLLESFLLREVLRPGDSVLVHPGAYFESVEQIASIPWLRVIVPKRPDAIGLLASIKAEEPVAVFVDPMSNTHELQLLDIPALLQEAGRICRRETWFVIDGTLVSGGFDPFAVPSAGQSTQVLYYESGSKYLQFGLDLALCGLVVVPAHLGPQFERLRRNTGTIISESHAAALPRTNRPDYMGHMRHMTETALEFAREVQRLAIGRRYTATPVFPGLPDHPGHAAATAYAHLGGLVTFRFPDLLGENRLFLDTVIERVMHEARKCGCPVSHGVSFGFNAPRISAAWAMAETCPPFLRVTSGVRPLADPKTLAAVIVNSIDTIAAEFNASRVP